MHALVREVRGRYQGARARRGGTAFQERFWSTRHLREGSDWGHPSNAAQDDWVAHYWESRHHLHRKLLTDAIVRWAPASVLEMGCNCGPNLACLARRLPTASLTGIDINPEAIARGRQLVAAEGLHQITLRQGSTDLLAEIPSASVDVVFTDAFLIYIASDRIMSVLNDVLRVARTGCVLVECHSSSSHSADEILGTFDCGCWRRDYGLLLAHCAKPPRDVSITKIPESVWPAQPWRRWGHIVEAAV